jgi:hypothetical protein
LDLRCSYLQPQTLRARTLDAQTEKEKFIVGAKLLASLLQGIDATKRRPKDKGQEKLENPKPTKGMHIQMYISEIS